MPHPNLNHPERWIRAIEEANMDERGITGSERKCISECIYRHWTSDHNKVDEETRDRSYESCLAACSVCD